MKVIEKCHYFPTVPFVFRQVVISVNIDSHKSYPCHQSKLYAGVNMYELIDFRAERIVF